MNLVLCGCESVMLVSNICYIVNVPSECPMLIHSTTVAAFKHMARHVSLRILGAAAVSC